VIELNCLYVCNTSSDCISKVDLKVFREESKISVSANKLIRTGPHGISTYNDKLLVANSYGNSLSIIDIRTQKETDCFYIGSHCNDVAVNFDNAYVICGELNNVIVFNLAKNKIVEEIPCGNLPHSISKNISNELIVIANMESDSVTLIDAVNRDVIKNIKVGPYPTNAVFTPDSRWILVCESNLGSNCNGNISIIDLKTYEICGRIPVGNSPVYILAEDNEGYVSNFGDGTISVIDLKMRKEKSKFYVGGMPRGIVKYENFLYIGDNYNNLLLRLDILKKSKKAISIGGEPTGMTLV
jgi:YVTN family beta-propeller protein